MYIVSTGMVCPVGLTAADACAAMRAGVDKFEELPYMDNSGEPIVGAMIPAFGPNLKREDRLIELLSAALIDCLNQGYPKQMDMVPLIVALAERGRPGGCSALTDRIVPIIEQKLKLRFHPQLSRVISSGHTAGFEALAIARELLRDRHIPTCIVCGVDSYVNASSLWWLEQHWRLKTEENSDGVIPGEAAAAVLVCANQNMSSKKSVRLIGLGIGTESAAVMTEEPLLGLGLTAASKIALSEAGIQMHQIAFRLSDITGESYGFREQALVVGRLLRVHRKEGYPIWHVSESIGDTGSAAGIIQLILSFHAYHKGYAPGEVAMCFSSAESGRRAVVLLASNNLVKVES